MILNDNFNIIMYIKDSRNYYQYHNHRIFNTHHLMNIPHTIKSLLSWILHQVSDAHTVIFIPLLSYIFIYNKRSTYERYIVKFSRNGQL